MKKFLLILILSVGLYFRFIGVNWDQNQHLHPDERFLTMVGTAMKMPKSFSDYLNPKTSTFNPENIGYKFYVYGTFPVVLNKLLAAANGADNYNLFTIQGRMLSAFFDFLIILLVYKTAKLLTNRHPERSEGSSDRRSRNASLDSSVTSFPQNDNIALWAAFFYAIAVYPIQTSHFFTTDTFLNFFMFGSFYLALRYYVGALRAMPLQDLILSAIFFSLALACKISAVYILPLILFFIIRRVLLKESPFKGESFCKLIGFVLLIYFVLRLADPYYFQSANFFDPRLNSSFLNSIKSLTQFTRPDVWYPPTVQWIGKPVSFLLINLMFFGVGIPYFIFMVIGMVSVIPTKQSAWRNLLNNTLFLILLWVVGYFVYQSFQFVKSIRYTIYLYPFFAIFAGIGINFILERIKNNKTSFIICNLLFVILLMVWPLAFTSIYRQKHSRVAASEWIYKNLPGGSYILSESWDDSLPLPVANNYGKQFSGEQLPVFDPDNPEKWKKINMSLEKANYYILSSNRGWGSIMDTPSKYPLMSKFYQDLFNGETNYKKIIEFTAYPKFQISNFKFQINDGWSEEMFTVYDHPKVLIYKNVKKL